VNVERRIELGLDYSLFGIRWSPYELPIKIPAANTSAPPTMTWNAACKNGVSM
jgi:hypothetical protein